MNKGCFTSKTGSLAGKKAGKKLKRKMGNKYFRDLALKRWATPKD